MADLVFHFKYDLIYLMQSYPESAVLVKGTIMELNSIINKMREQGKELNKDIIGEFCTRTINEIKAGREDNELTRVEGWMVGRMRKLFNALRPPQSGGNRKSRKNRIRRRHTRRVKSRQ